ncbi:PREDICTED: uncharacterized protein LOC108563987 [Nicrophorus vespilloides]|uniref:Uncharacterized protein LOC108563987 n=1 Tax=Nicrophorus vespilloides TaxID=110193 RepID=A0ABM1MUU2_NICVS|nr:PREDICTED: uncharacterized protein LOC108563987 [Nicrophorus vespilloides]
MGLESRMDEEVECKHIEEIIDARKRSGQYDALIGGGGGGATKGPSARYAYSKPACPIEEVRRDEFAMYNIEGDNLNETRPTDSEITLIRVKREGSQLRTQLQHNTNWDMHDRAVPGDGSHLGESPSLVNLVTLVVPSKEMLKTRRGSREVEYMVPLSSWEPAEPTLVEYPEEENVRTAGSSSTIKDLFRCFIFWRRNSAARAKEDDEE